MRNLFLAGMALSLAGGVSLPACADPGKGHSQNISGTKPMDIEFTSEASISAWKSVNDGVMGGRSSGGIYYDGEVNKGKGAMVFRGAINTNGGGFASIRTDMKPGDLAQASAVKLRVKSDGRSYKLTFRTDARARWRRVSFQGQIPITPKGQWTQVSVPLEALNPSVFGRPVRGAVFEKAKVEEMGIILADGVDGPFKLEVASISTP